MLIQWHFVSTVSKYQAFAWRLLKFGFEVSFHKIVCVTGHAIMEIKWLLCNSKRQIIRLAAQDEGKTWKNRRQPLSNCYLTILAKMVSVQRAFKIEMQWMSWRDKCWAKFESKFQMISMRQQSRINPRPLRSVNTLPRLIFWSMAVWLRNRLAQDFTSFFNSLHMNSN